jgi:hypothetical protein
MADDQTQAEQTVEETPQEPMPSSEQTAETQTEEVEASPKETDELPEGVKERTSEQFNKLKRELAEEREKRTKLERAYAPPQPAIPEWYDPNTGVVDPNRLQQREQMLISELHNLKQQVQGYTKQSEAQQEKEAYAAYPDLKTNERFHEEVIRKLATEFAIGNNPTMKEAADSVMEFAKGLTSKAEKEGARKALEQLAPKEQASLEATGRSDRRLPSQDLATLSRQSRYGNESATAAILARLKNVPSV